MKIEIDLFEDLPYELSRDGFAYRLTINDEPISANPKRINKRLSWFSTFNQAVEATANYLNIEPYQIGWEPVLNSNNNLTGWNGYVEDVE
jgi:hypothetical protein